LPILAINLGWECPQHHRIGYCTLDNAANNDTAVRSLGGLFDFDAEERRLRCGSHFNHLIVQAMIYGLGSKAVSIRELLGQYGDRDFNNDENTNSGDGDSGDSGDAGDSDSYALFTAVDGLSFESDFKDEDADSTADEDEDYDTQFPAIAALIFSRITTITLAKYRRDGPFGKLRTIGVLLRKSSQLKSAFNDAQQAVTPGQPPLAWVHNVATRWSSDYAMAKRSQRLKRTINRLFIDIE
jgi:hypothetical protein